MGDNFERQNLVFNQDEEEVQRIVKEDLFLRLEWITNLKKLVLVKCGMFSNTTINTISVRSLLLDNLLSFFSTEASPSSSLHCLWIQDFLLYYSPQFMSFLSTAAHSLKSCFLSGVELRMTNDYEMGEYSNVEHLGGIKIFASPNQQDERCGAFFMPKLKHARILDCAEDEKQVHIKYKLELKQVHSFIHTFSGTRPFYSEAPSS